MRISDWSSDVCSSDLLVEAGKIAAKGVEALGQEGVAFARKSFEDTSAALKGYTAIKTPADFFKLYAENSKKAFDAEVAQTSKTSELVVKLTNESFAQSGRAPCRERVCQYV